MHQPVLLKEVVAGLQLKPGDFVIDGTVGSGGHAFALIRQIAPGGIFLGLDWDEENIKRLKQKIGRSKKGLSKLLLREGNYADLPVILQKEKLGLADGLLLDLGFSSLQLVGGRGFSFGQDEPLLMTYSLKQTPLYRLLPRLTQKQLEEIIRQLSQERYAGRIARAIKEREKRQPITTSGELAEVIRRAVPKSYERGRIDPATRTFMALRIYINDELTNLENILRQLDRVVKRGGRAAIISFHSLEDRLVKNYWREWVKRGKMKLITKKPIVPGRQEILLNPRSRSAKLRIGELI
jgi:16S rRNA (cytosine1402-N4)-methyltransferase